MYTKSLQQKYEVFELNRVWWCQTEVDGFRMYLESYIHLKSIGFND